MKMVKVDLKDIEQNENSRAVYKEADLRELMHSMKLDGLLQPVGVRDLGKGKYEAVYGNRRLVAARKLGWADIDCVVVEAVTDNDRDFMNLVENIKRQNITVVEEGRLYTVLLDRGLKPGEIAARIGVSDIRVSTALDAVKHIPADMASRVVNRIGGTNTKKQGKISATAYVAVAHIRKQQQLNRPQWRALLEFASKDGINALKIHTIAPFLKNGFTLEEAIEKAEHTDAVHLNVFVDRTNRERLEKKYNATFQELCIRALETMPELKIQRRPSRIMEGSSGYRTKASSQRTEREAERRANNL